MSCKTIGIIGGGQLGLMIIEEAHNLGAKTICLDPSIDCPASKISDEFICASFDDYEALDLLFKSSDVVTYEFENIKSEYLIEFEQKYNIKQGIKPLFDSQDRIREKDNANKHGLKTARYFDILSKEDVLDAINELGYPCLYKTRTLGYDGHGQVLIKTEDDISDVLKYIDSPGIIEEFITFDYEVSIVMVNDEKQVINFPISRNVHKGGILDLSILPSGMSSDLEQRIISASKNFMKECGYKGILTIEYFIKGEDFYFNEMAPRPHNSGHYTIEGCTTNQFRELSKFLLDIKLEEPKLIKPTVMKNILGVDTTYVNNFSKYNNAFIHMYGKTENRPKRKMGHVTVVGCTLEEYNKIQKEVSEE